MNMIEPVAMSQAVALWVVWLLGIFFLISIFERRWGPGNGPFLGYMLVSSLWSGAIAGFALLLGIYQ